MAELTKDLEEHLVRGIGWALDALLAPVGRRVGASGPHRRSVLVFDTTHSLGSIEASEHQQIILQRALGGFFEEVIVLHSPSCLLDVAAMLRRRVPGIAVLFVGEGELRASLEQRCREMDLQDTVYFVGLKHQDWLARVYPHAALYLSPLTGRSLAEAALAGIPLVAYDTDWHGEIVETGVTGELVPFRDTEAMAEACLRVLEDPDYARRLGEGARRRGLEMMDQRRILEVERGAYARLLEGASGAA